MATNNTKMGSNCDSDREKLLYCVQTRPKGSKLPHERAKHYLIWGCKLQMFKYHAGCHSGWNMPTYSLGAGHKESKGRKQEGKKRRKFLYCKNNLEALIWLSLVGQNIISLSYSHIGLL